MFAKCIVALGVLNFHAVVCLAECPPAESPSADGPAGLSLVQRGTTLVSAFKAGQSSTDDAPLSPHFKLLAAMVVLMVLYTIWRDFRSRPEASVASESVADELYDVLIVGGGFGGAYTAHQVKKEFPHKKVLVIEKTDHIGGRLKSVRCDAAHGDMSLVKQELGGMRIFPSKMPKVAQAVKDAGCNLVDVSLSDEHNVFYYKGKRWEKGSYKMPSGRTCGQMSDACTKKWLQAHPEDKGRDCYLSHELRRLSLSEFFAAYGATPEEIEAHNTYGGYDLNGPNITASLYIKDGELYGAALSKDQKYVHEGYMTVVEELLKRSGAEVHMESKVVAIAEDVANDLVQVTAASNSGKSTVYKAKQVLVSLPFDQMSELVESFDISPCRKLALEQNVQVLPLFKCFLEWEESKVWWKKLGYECGKSSTDLDLRQVHYYDGVDILIYNSGPYAVKWDARFQQNPEKAARTAFEMLKELHNLPNMPEPLWERTHYKFWVDGSHKWKVGTNIYEAMNTICHGQGDNSNIYLCGDAVSGYQGWVCGAIETADICLEKMRPKLAGKEGVMAKTKTLF